MAFQKKVVILSDITSQGGTGIVKITEDGNETTADVTIYCDIENTVLLLSIDNNLTAFNIDKKNILNLGNTQLTGIIDCLVVDSRGKALLYGSTGGDKFRCFNLLEEYRKQDNLKKNLKTDKETDEATINNSQLNEPIILAKKEEKQKKFPTDDNTNDKTNSNSIKQGKNNENNGNIAVDNDNVVADSDISTTKDDDIDALNDNDENCKDFKIKSSQPILNKGIQYDGNNFYLAVKPQLDEMFICYPSDTELTDIVPNSKWIRVSIEDDYYVVGVIFDIDEPKYICYGIHGFFKQKPPTEIEHICEWLPLNLEEPENEGYWLIYQSASTGKTLKNE